MRNKKHLKKLTQGHIIHYTICMYVHTFPFIDLYGVHSYQNSYSVFHTSLNILQRIIVRVVERISPTNAMIHIYVF